MADIPFSIQIAYYFCSMRCDMPDLISDFEFEWILTPENVGPNISSPRPDKKIITVSSMDDKR
jgi:hypothetical protein